MTATPPPLAQEEKAPAAIRIFGILNVLFGAFGALSLASSLIPNPQSAEILELVPSMKLLSNPLLQIWGGILTAILLASGIGLLLKKPWGRIVAVVYAVILVGHLIFMVPRFVEFYGTFSEIEDEIGKIAAYSTFGGGVVGLFVNLVYAVILVIFMKGGRVKAFFRNGL